MSDPLGPDIVTRAYANAIRRRDEAFAEAANHELMRLMIGGYAGLNEECPVPVDQAIILGLVPVAVYVHDRDVLDSRFNTLLEANRALLEAFAASQSPRPPGVSARPSGADPVDPPTLTGDDDIPTPAVETLADEVLDPSVEPSNDADALDGEAGPRATPFDASEPATTPIVPEVAAQPEAPNEPGEVDEFDGLLWRAITNTLGSSKRALNIQDIEASLDVTRLLGGRITRIDSRKVALKKALEAGVEKGLWLASDSGADGRVYAKPVTAGTDARGISR